MARENATPRPWTVERNTYGVTVRRPSEYGSTPICEIWANGDDRESNAALIVEAVNAYDTLRAENERLKAAIRAILAVETHLLHCGYDDGPGGGNYVYKDVIRTDDEAFALARAALSEAQP